MRGRIETPKLAPITIRLRPSSSTPRQRQYTCLLAGRLIHLDEMPAALAPFQIGSGVAPALPDMGLARPASAPYAETRGLIDKVERSIACWRDESGTLIEIEDGGLFHVDATGTRITHQGMAGLDRGAVVIGLIGPVLGMALAINGTYCLHASAVMRKDGAVLFLGESGVGKSTLSASLAADGAWQRIGDDGLPIRGTVALPHYPQLKLPAEEQIALSAPQAVAIRAIYVLGAADPSADAAIRDLSPREAVRELIFHTSIVSLFAPEMLLAHAGAMAHLAARVPVKRLILPHRREALGMVRGLVEDGA